MTKETKNLSEVEVTVNKNEGETNSGESKTFDDLMDALDRLESANDMLVKSSRLRGIVEGSLVTLGSVVLGGLAVVVLNKRNGK